MDEANIVAQAQDEALLDPAPPVSSTPTKPVDLASLLSSLSSPTHLPPPPTPRATDPETSISGAFDRLLLLSASSTPPLPKPHLDKPGQPPIVRKGATKSFMIPGFDPSRDNDVESWCCEFEDTSRWVLCDLLRPALTRSNRIIGCDVCEQVSALRMRRWCARGAKENCTA